MELKSLLWTSQMHLITSFANQSEERNQEIQFAQTLNTNNPLVTNISVLSEDNLSWFSSSKAKVVQTSSRPTFRDFVNFANSLGDGQVCIIANADIAFDSTLSKANIYKDDIVYSLTRWFPDVTALTKDISSEISWWKDQYAYMSSDSWIFKTPIYRIKNIGFPMGVLGCDNRFNYELIECGKRLVNPSKIIRTLHVHSSNIRNYSSESLYGNYACVEITDVIEYNENNVRKGWHERGAGFWPHYYSWLTNVSDFEFWCREDIPEEIRCMYPIHSSGRVRKRPRDMSKLKSDWEIELKRRMLEDPMYDNQGNWTGTYNEKRTRV